MAASDLITFGEPTIHRDGMSLGFEWARNGEPILRIQMADVRQDGDDIFADVTVWWLHEQALGVRPIMPMSKVKLNSAHSTGWRTIGSQCSKRIPNVDWDGAVSLAVDECIMTLMTGAPNVLLGKESESDDEPFILKPFIANSGSTVMYGEGGLSKSLLALAMGLSVSTGVPIFGREPHVVGPVMYFDYEDDSSSHDRRLRALCRSFGIPLSEVRVYHHALVSKVVTAKREMRRRVDETGAVLGILDSVGMGRGGSAIAAEDTIRMFRSLREVGVPFLAIDHVSKESKEKKGGSVDAYGSIYTMNSARLGWSLTRQLTNDDRIHIHALNTKANHVRALPPQTISIKYLNDERGVPERIDIEVGNEFGMLMPTVSLSERMMMWLGHGEWRSYEQLAEELGVETSAIRMVLSRDRQRDMPTFETKQESNRGWARLSRNKGAVTPPVTPQDTEVEDDETQ